MRGPVHSSLVVLVLAAVAGGCGSSSSARDGSEASSNPEAFSDASPESVRGGSAADSTAASDCDGLVPSAPGAPSRVVLANQDLTVGACIPGDSNGVGTLSVGYADEGQPHGVRYSFVNPQSGSVEGGYGGPNLQLVGQSNGFLGGECQGALCTFSYDVLGPTGNLLYRRPVDGSSGGAQANDPTGGMVFLRVTRDAANVQTLHLDAVDQFGKLRWTRVLPDTMAAAVGPYVTLGVDRHGNVLALWNADARYGAGAFAGEWFTHGGDPGPVFEALSSGSPVALYERVDSGLFLRGNGEWLGQFSARSTSLKPAPAWLKAHPGSTLHMIHGGRGYALLPGNTTSPSCEQEVQIVSPSGKVCGASNFSVGGGACTTSSITVGYDGTVLQQLPFERETCTAYDHQCTCTWRYWPRYFR